jgi:putative transferase (TIGR04331 family)
LEDNIKSNLILRIHPMDNWNIKMRFSDDFDQNRISKKNSLKKDILRSKIIINTTTQTTLYQSMKSGVPTLIIFDRDILKINPLIQELLNEFKKNNIMFSDPSKAADHVKNIWSDPLRWWNSDKIIKLREKFSLLCSKEVKNDLFFWNEFFNSKLAEK